MQVGRVQRRGNVTEVTVAAAGVDPLVLPYGRFA